MRKTAIQKRIERRKEREKRAFPTTRTLIISVAVTLVMVGACLGWFMSVS